MWENHNFEMFFGVFDFFQKSNENKSTWCIIVVKLNSFVYFLKNQRFENIITTSPELYTVLLLQGDAWNLTNGLTQSHIYWQ